VAFNLHGDFFESRKHKNRALNGGTCLGYFDWRSDGHQQRNRARQRSSPVPPEETKAHLEIALKYVITFMLRSARIRWMLNMQLSAD
jgi:hypothetical protein